MYCAVNYSLPLASLIIGVVDGLAAGVENVKAVLYRAWAERRPVVPPPSFRFGGGAPFKFSGPQKGDLYLAMSVS